MKKEQNCLNYICKLPVRFDKESKNEKKLSKETKEKYKFELKSLCNFASANIKEIISKDTSRTEKQKSEDLSFLDDQLGPRIMKFGKDDFSYEKRVSAKLQRNMLAINPERMKRQRNEYCDTDEYSKIKMMEIMYLLGS